MTAHTRTTSYQGLQNATTYFRERLAAVEALHHPSTDHGDGMKPYCVGCWEACGEEGAPLWPCPTIRAATGVAP